MKQLILCFLLLVSLLIGCGQEQEGTPASEPEPPPATTETGDSEEQPSIPAPEPEPEKDPRQEAVEAVLETMSLEEKVGQMFFVRCPETGAAEKISKYHLGGYVLFARDFKDKAPQQVREMIERYQNAAKVPLLIGADEEGGTVTRLSRYTALFPEKFRSPQEVFASGGLEAVAEDAALKSDGLLGYGVNVNLAPVADVSTDPGDFIYARAFGQGPQETAEFVRTVVQEMREAGIGSVLKHFPGYGNNVDTHTGVAVDERPYSEFVEADFLPFQAGIGAGAGAVLVSHNIVCCMDGELPASLSPEVHRVLREELGFEGVVMTDELSMSAVDAYAGDGSVALLAVSAGNDMIVTTDFEKQIPLVVEAVKAGQLDEEIINDAVRRVLGWKFDLGLIGTEQEG